MIKNTKWARQAQTTLEGKKKERKMRLTLPDVKT